MAKGNEFTGAFGPLNGCNTSNTQHIALGRVAGPNKSQDIRTHGNEPTGFGLSRGVRLKRDIHHLGLAVLVEMTQWGIGRGITREGAHRSYDKAMNQIFSRNVVGRQAAVCLACLVALVNSLGLATPAFAQTRVGSEQLPQLGEADADGLSLQAERRLGRQVFQEFLRAGVVTDDPELEDYLSAQSARLLQAALVQGHLQPGQSIEPGEFRFFAVRDPAINAFALPGGFIGIHTGLMARSQSESELMSVLAHEIGHVSQRHISRQFGQRRQSSAVMIAAALLAAMAASNSSDAAMGIMSLGQTVAVQDQLAFSREAEREADRVGLGLLQEAGFDPQAMVSLFQKLLRAGEFYDSAAPNWVRSHPLTTERIADVQTRLTQIRPESGSSRFSAAMSSPAQREVKDTLEFRWLRQRIDALSDRSVDGLAKSALRLKKAFDETRPQSADRSALAYAMAWVTLQQRQFPPALDWLSRAEVLAREEGELDWAAPLLASARLEILLAAGQLQDAAQVMPSAIEAGQQSISQRQLARQTIRLMQGLSRYPQALDFAKSYTNRWPDDLQGWALKAQVASAAGQQTLAHWATAERYRRAGALNAALEQLQLARKANDADFSVMSVIDARLAGLRREIQNEKNQSPSAKLSERN